MKCYCNAAIHIWVYCLFCQKSKKTLKLLIIDCSERRIHWSEINVERFLIGFPLQPCASNTVNHQTYLVGKAIEQMLIKVFLCIWLGLLCIHHLLIYSSPCCHYWTRANTVLLPGRLANSRGTHEFPVANSFRWNTGDTFISRLVILRWKLAIIIDLRTSRWVKLLFSQVVVFVIIIIIKMKIRLLS